MTDMKERFLNLVEKVLEYDVDIRWQLRGSYIDLIEYRRYEPNQPSVVTLQGYKSAGDYLYQRLQHLRLINLEPWERR